MPSPKTDLFLSCLVNALGLRRAHPPENISTRDLLRISYLRDHEMTARERYLAEGIEQALEDYETKLLYLRNAKESQDVG